MGRTLTAEGRKLRDDAIRLRQELGWSKRRIAAHLEHNESTIRYWLRNNLESDMRKNNKPLPLNQVHIMDCIRGMNRLPHDYIDLVFADPPYLVSSNKGS